ncbi:Uncharacterised protein [Mycobacteroides abscessus subsp. abscessus]|nr:Uncharacterised protein [Mycobacteroides abscessus subsp. abscessus]
MLFVNVVLSVALLLGIINIHLGIVIAKRHNNGLFGLLNWGMAFILFMTAILKIYEYSI